MKVHMHTKFCLICLLTFVFHHCNHCHEGNHDHGAEESHTHDHNDYQISEAPYLPNSGVRSNPDVLSLLEAEREQTYFIEKLFDRYGENGRLSFYGLEKLLASLGLGEVKVVEMEHEDVGHDHISHLDILEVQEGKHSHSNSNSHAHSHSHSNHLDSEKQTTKNTKCIQVKNRTVDSNMKIITKHSHNHDDHHHHHHQHNHHHHLDHNTTHHVHNDSVSHVEQKSDSSTETNATQEQPDGKLKKHKKKRKGKKTIEATAGFTTVTPQVEHSDQHHHHELDHFHKYDQTQDSARSHDHDHTDNPADVVKQHHTQKREAFQQISVKKGTGSFITKHEVQALEKHQYEECLNVTQLLLHYGLSTTAPISKEQFTYLCPALLYQIDSRVCIRHYSELEVENLEKNESRTSAWLWGIISISIISLLSLLGVILVPIINQGCFKFLLTFLVALAVGTLSGDALLHLLPHSQGGHDHSHDHHNHDHGLDHTHEHEEPINLLTEYDAMWKGLMVLGGIYLLFIIEHCIQMFKHYKGKWNKKKWLKKTQKGEESVIGRKLSDHKLNRRSDAEWLHLEPLTGPDESAVSDGPNETQMTDLDCHQGSPSQNSPFPEEEAIMSHHHAVHIHDIHTETEYHSDDRGRKIRSNKHSHLGHSHHSHGHCHSNKDIKDAGIASIAWMVIMGDGMHNFSDGLAIGAAFSAGLTGGVSTSVAVFCHELPHELGDFAVLLKAGMTVKQAIVYNLLSALMAYVGMLIGTAVGQYANDVTPWIFAITAGMFLYVALVDMLPEMLHGDEDKYGHCQLGHFLLQNLGILLGFGIMLLIAIYEDKIVIDF
ncbi:zinc transporter ZIP10 [Latimeria chalumnae]|uniref:zinc transporter ZIP10 n=1 Tax=Latimeria chalumnae TaxID=7897 RepID=UPI00313C8181